MNLVKLRNRGNVLQTGFEEFLKTSKAVFTIYEHTVCLGELTMDVIKVYVPLNTAALPAL